MAPEPIRQNIYAPAKNNYLIELIRNNEINIVLNKLSSHSSIYSNDQLSEELILLTQQWEEIERFSRLSMIDSETSTRKKSRIIVGLINIVRKLE